MMKLLWDGTHCPVHETSYNHNCPITAPKAATAPKI